MLIDQDGVICQDSEQAPVIGCDPVRIIAKVKVQKFKELKLQVRVRVSYRFAKQIRSNMISTNRNMNSW